MPKLEAFKLPSQDTRLIKCKNTVYKFKLQYRDGSNRLPCDVSTMQEEMESVVHSLLHIKEDLHPVRTDHFVIYPYKRRWRTARQLKFYQGQTELQAYPYVLYVYVEPKIAQAKKTLSDTICHALESSRDEDKGEAEESNTDWGDEPQLSVADIDAVLNTEHGYLFTPPPKKAMFRKPTRQGKKTKERCQRTQEPDAITPNKEPPMTQADELPPVASPAAAPGTSRKTYRLGRRYRTMGTPISGRPRRILLHSRPDRHAIESFQLSEQQRLQQMACPTSTTTVTDLTKQNRQPDHTEETSMVGSFLRMLIHPARQLFGGQEPH